MSFDNLGLVLMGGGLAGCGQTGIAKVLWQRKIIPKKIQGISVGALNGAELVANGPESLEKVWLDVEKNGPHVIFNWWRVPMRIFRGKSSFFGDYGLNLLINNMDIRKVVGSPIEFDAVARNESNRNKLTAFNNRDPMFKNDPELFRKAIKSSAALPGFFPPVEINQQWYADGYRFYLESMVDCDNILIVMNDKPPSSHTENRNGPKRLFDGFNYVLNSLIEKDIEEFLDNHKEFDRFEVDSPLSFFERALDWFKTKFGNLVGAGKKRLIIMSPSYNIPTLQLDTFKTGDITLAIQKAAEQFEKLLNKIEQEN